MGDEELLTPVVYRGDPVCRFINLVSLLSGRRIQAGEVGLNESHTGRFMPVLICVRPLAWKRGPFFNLYSNRPEVILPSPFLYESIGFFDDVDDRETKAFIVHHPVLAGENCATLINKCFSRNVDHVRGSLNRALELAGSTCTHGEAALS